MKRRDTLSLLLVPPLAALGCSKPRPPTLNARSVRVSGTARYQMELSVQLDVHNPNSFPLVMTQVQAKCVLSNGDLLGSGSGATAVTIPASSDQSVEVKLNVELESERALPPFYYRGKPREYVLRGTATFGSDDPKMMVPFSLQSALTSDEQSKTGLAAGGIK